MSNKFTEMKEFLNNIKADKETVEIFEGKIKGVIAGVPTQEVFDDFIGAGGYKICFNSGIRLMDGREVVVKFFKGVGDEVAIAAEELLIYKMAKKEQVEEFFVPTFGWIFDKKESEKARFDGLVCAEKLDLDLGNEWFEENDIKLGGFILQVKINKTVDAAYYEDDELENVCLYNVRDSIIDGIRKGKIAWDSRETEKRSVIATCEWNDEKDNERMKLANGFEFDDFELWKDGIDKLMYIDEKFNVVGMYWIDRAIKEYGWAAFDRFQEFVAKYELSDLVNRNIGYAGYDWGRVIKGGDIERLKTAEEKGEELRKFGRDNSGDMVVIGKGFIQPVVIDWLSYSIVGEDVVEEVEKEIGYSGEFKKRVENRRRYSWR